MRRRLLRAVAVAATLTLVGCVPTAPDSGCGHVYPNPCEHPELFGGQP